MNPLRLILAAIWTAAWGTARYLIAIAEWQNGQRRPRWRDAFSWSFRHSPKAARCSVCGWTGPLRWAGFTSVGCGPDFRDTEFVEVCPKCGAEDTLRAVLRPRKGYWTS